MDDLYKRLARVEAMAAAQKSELMETLKEAYERACEERNDEDAAAFARKIRNKMLEMSDKEMVIDRHLLNKPVSDKWEDWFPWINSFVDVVSNAWANYRQLLRDVPEQAGFPFDIDFPKAPNEEIIEG